jgi:hypothetical protein
MRHSLVPDERLLAKAHFHWIYTAYSLVVAALLIAATGPVKRFAEGAQKAVQDYLVSDQAHWIGDANIPHLFQFAGSPLWHTVPPLVLFGVAVIFVGWRAIVQFTTEIVVTDSRLVAKQGVFRIRTFKTDLTQLGQVDVDQSLLGHILGYGTIHIYTRNWGGKGDQMAVEGIYLPPIADPHNFSTQVDRARRMWRKGQV